MARFAPEKAIHHRPANVFLVVHEKVIMDDIELGFFDEFQALGDVLHVQSIEWFPKGK